MSDIDRNVAEQVMGWKCYEYADEFESDEDYKLPFGSCKDYIGWLLHIHTKVNPYESFMFTPSTNSEQAMDIVVEKMRELGYDCSLKIWGDNNQAIFCKGLKGGLYEKHSLVSAETIPLAICLAALEAVK